MTVSIHQLRVFRAICDKFRCLASYLIDRMDYVE